MAQHHIFVGPLRRPQRVVADFKLHNGRLADAAGEPLFVQGNMAAVAVLVGYRVADLAGKVAKVLLVLGVACSVNPDILMAVFTFCCIRIIIAAVCQFSRAMKLLAVAIGAEHCRLSPVDVGRETLIFPEVLGANAGAVAGNAVILR